MQCDIFQCFKTDFFMRKFYHSLQIFVICSQFEINHQGYMRNVLACIPLCVEMIVTMLILLICE